MESAPTHPLGAWRPALKQRWAARLQLAPAGPPGSGLVTPEMLVMMIDATLDQVQQAEMASRRRAKPDRLPAARGGAHCGLHLVLAYYLAGIHTVRETLPAGLRPAAYTLIALARGDVAALCGACHHKHGAFCALVPPKRGPTRASGEGSRD